jgi:guanosine-3',5'-bis(diphosphate) 3'-pyrophosphohydrolase
MISTDANQLLFDAIAFAARAHRHQIRKDGQTPYVSHVFRVAMVVRQVFGFDDPKLMTAAILHDTIEDTTTDYDDIADRFGDDIAKIVVALTKDMRMPDAEREEAYLKQLVAGGWPVLVCKLADVYDNLGDSAHLSPKSRGRTIKRSQDYLDAFRTLVPPEAAKAFRLVEARVAEMEKSMAGSRSA